MDTSGAYSRVHRIFKGGCVPLHRSSEKLKYPSNQSGHWVTFQRTAKVAGFNRAHIFCTSARILCHIICSLQFQLGLLSCVHLSHSHVLYHLVLWSLQSFSRRTIQWLFQVQSCFHSICIQCSYQSKNVARSDSVAMISSLVVSFGSWRQSWNVVCDTWTTRHIVK